LQPAAWLTQALRSDKDTLALPFAPPCSGNERRAELHIYGGSRKRIARHRRVLLHANFRAHIAEASAPRYPRGRFLISGNIKLNPAARSCIRATATPGPDAKARLRCSRSPYADLRELTLEVAVKGAPLCPAHRRREDEARSRRD